MSHLLARIMLALLMAPLASILYMLLLVFLDYRTRWNDEVCLVFAGATTLLFAAAYWVLLWRRSVKWTANRIGLTFGSAGAALAVGVLVGVFAGTIVDEFGAFIWSPTAVFLWMTCTVFIWRETAAERSSRIETMTGTGLACPRCGYNMTGLHQSLCPECGATFTIEELLAEQQCRQADELEPASMEPAEVGEPVDW